MRRTKQAQFILPKSDFAFRQLLENETIRERFISDVTGIPLTEIKSSKMINTFLWREHSKQKQGIVDALVELRDGTRITIEIQLQNKMHWDKRQLFYWSKAYIQGLAQRERYDKWSGGGMYGISKCEGRGGFEYADGKDQEPRNSGGD